MHRLIWIIVGQALCCGVAVAQDHAVTAVGETGATQSAVRSNATPKSGGEPSPLSPPRPLREIEPALYYLKDKDGNLLPAPGFHYDDFKELYNLKNQLEQLQQRPRYTLQQMAAVGTVSGQRAELTIRFKILIDDKNWVRVPLRLEQAVLAQPVQYEGPGQQFTHFEENGEGYVAWIRGRSGEQHELTLKVLVGLSSAGEGTRLRLFLPRATSSDLKFTLPSADVVAKVSEGATLLDSPADDKFKNDVHVIGLGGDFELSWRAAGGRSVETPKAGSSRVSTAGISIPRPASPFAATASPSIASASGFPAALNLLPARRRATRLRRSRRAARRRTSGWSRSAWANALPGRWKCN
jgi:hypothetical protein